MASRRRVNFNPSAKRAVRLTVCEEWSAARKAWLRVAIEDGPSRIVASCGMQAALRVGDLDVFKYFRGLYGLLTDGAPLPAELTTEVAKMAKIEGERLKANGVVEASLLQAAGAETDFALGYYERALNRYLRLVPFGAAQRKRVASIYLRIGLHDELLAILAEMGAEADSNLRSKGERVVRLIERRRDPWDKIERRFFEQHFAGSVE